MNETPLPNDAAARSPTGEILSPEQIQAKGTPTSSTTEKTEPEATEEQPASKDGKSLASKAEAKPAEGAPEKYEAFKVPEGFELAEAVQAEAGTLFKELGLTQANAQRLIDFYTAKSQESVQAPFKLWEDTQAKWVDEVKQEHGTKLDSVLQTISKAVDSIGDVKLASDFREAMDFTGAGNNPAFIRAFYKLAQRLTEGSPLNGRGPSPLGQPNQRPATAAQALYPNLAP
jgi:antitoxin component of RelBE/YafQ-DinJ toxin-antitoxin module